MRRVRPPGRPSLLLKSGSGMVYVAIHRFSDTYTRRERWRRSCIYIYTCRYVYVYTCCLCVFVQIYVHLCTHLYVDTNDACKLGPRTSASFLLQATSRVCAGAVAPVLSSPLHATEARRQSTSKAGLLLRNLICFLDYGNLN